MKKKLVIMLLASVVVAGSFAGCSGGSDAAEETAQAEETETPTPTEAQETETPTPTETPEEAEEVDMYTLAKTVLREEDNKKSRKLATLAVNTKVTVTEEGDKWCKVEADGQEGYVLAKNLTTDEAEAIAAADKIEQEAKREAAEKAAAEAAAQEAAAQAEAEAAAAAAQAEADAAIQADAAAQAEADAAGDSIIVDDGAAAGTTERYEVSRENVDDCDGSGHGYTIITYSDGSQDTVDY